MVLKVTVSVADTEVPMSAQTKRAPADIAGIRVLWGDAGIILLWMKVFLKGAEGHR